MVCKLCDGVVGSAMAERLSLLAARWKVTGVEKLKWRVRQAGVRGVQVMACDTRMAAAHGQRDQTAGDECHPCVGRFLKTVSTIARHSVKMISLTAMFDSV